MVYYYWDCLIPDRPYRINLKTHISLFVINTHDNVIKLVYYKAKCFASKLSVRFFLQIIRFHIMFPTVWQTAVTVTITVLGRTKHTINFLIKKRFKKGYWNIILLSEVADACRPESTGHPDNLIKENVDANGTESASSTDQNVQFYCVRPWVY